MHMLPQYGFTLTVCKDENKGSPINSATDVTFYILYSLCQRLCKAAATKCNVSPADHFLVQPVQMVENVQSCPPRGETPIITGHTLNYTQL